MGNLLKVNSRDDVSLLLTLKISKNFAQMFFWSAMNMYLFTVMLLFLQFLSIVFSVDLKQIS